MTEEQLRQGKILLVDDEVRSICLLESVLDRLRFKHIRKLGESAKILEAFEEYQPDLIITDIEMPEMDGIQLVEQIRNYLPRDACLPILVLTGSCDPQVKRKALLAGATNILFKPFDASEMQMRVRSLLQTRIQYLQIQNQNRELELKVAERTVELEKALSELKASQRQIVQQERFRAFGEMAGGVCHDFNNALMAVIGYSELLLQDPALGEDRELLRQYLKTVNTAGRDASQVVSRLRDFYRPRQESDVFSAVNINELIEQLGPLTKPKWHDQALETGRRIEFALELQRVPPVHGNGAELRETFMNLIFNAVDAMPAGGVITARTIPQDGGVRVEVADTGTGMTEEIRQRCLEPFFTTKGDHGTGLGLPMAFGIIRRHEGALEIDSTPGVGTTFSVWLPCCHSPGNEESEARLTLDRALRVLVVDDEANTREVVSGYLRSDGHRVQTAQNGHDALQQLMAEQYDVVITDHGMPGMNGAQLAGAVRRLDPGKSIILLTGFAIGEADKPAEIDTVLKKPIVPDELRFALRTVIGSRHTAAVAREVTLAAAPACTEGPCGGLSIPFAESACAAV